MATLADLDHAERQLVCAGMIDDLGRCQKEVSYWQQRVDALRRELASAPVPAQARS